MKTRYTTILILLSPLLFSDQIKLRIDEVGKVGVGVVNPSTKLDVDGSITIGNLNETETPKAGTIKFENGDFLGFDGSIWRSLTQSSSSSGSSEGSSGVSSGSLLALPATSSVPAGYTFVQSLDKSFMWEALGNRNYASFNGSLETIGQKIFLIGASSYNSNGLTEASPNERYDPVSNTWSVIESSAFPRYKPVTASYDNKIYLLPGLDLDGNFRELEIYDPEKNFWSFGTSLPDNFDIVRIHSAIALNGKIYCPSQGVTPSSSNVENSENEILIYNIQTSIWSSMIWEEEQFYPAMGVFMENYTPEGGLAYVSEGKLSILGNSQYENWITHYSAGTNQWSWGPLVQEGFSNLLGYTNNRLILGESGRVSVFDTRTGIMKSFSLNGIIEDNFSETSAVMLNDEIYICGALWGRSTKRFYKASLDSLMDLNIRN